MYFSWCELEDIKGFTCIFYPNIDIFIYIFYSTTYFIFYICSNLKEYTDLCGISDINSLPYFSHLFKTFSQIYFMYSLFVFQQDYVSQDNHMAINSYKM